MARVRRHAKLIRWRHEELTLCNRQRGAVDDERKWSFPFFLQWGKNEGRDEAAGGSGGHPESRGEGLGKPTHQQGTGDKSGDGEVLLSWFNGKWNFPPSK